MVLVDTTPRGAQVRAANGATLCAATPCAVPVPLGQQRSVRVVLGETELDAVLDATQAHASVDLSPLLSPQPAPRVPPAPVPSPPGRPVRRDRPRDEIPMLLPGSPR